MLSKARAHCTPPLGARLLSQVHRPSTKPPPASELEQYKTVKRRIAKAEREERMDITKALTPPKTYMGGFTRPQEIRVSNWWPGGRYAEAGKGYEKPSDSAYEPHTVVLLESRYDIVHQIGRADCLEHVVVVCRESDLPRVLKAYNSSASPEMEAMDNARWPWAKQKILKITKWWDHSENPSEEIKKLWAGEGEGFEISAQELTKLENEAADAEKARRELKAIWAPVARSTGNYQRGGNPRNTYRSARSTSPTRSNQAGRSRPSVHGFVASAGAPPPRRPNDRIQLFHTYLPLQAEDGKSTTSSDRAQIPTSSWSKPMKESQDANDDVVPVYYVERKRQLDDISERKEEEGSLMAELSAGILSEGIAAQTRGREEKIPVEVREADGIVRHPSGFEPPTPETEFHPVASKPDVEADPLLTTVKLHWDEALAPPENTAATPDVSAAAQVAPSLKATRNFHTSAFLRAQEAPNLPFHVLNAPAPPPQHNSAVASITVEEDAEYTEKEWELEENEEEAQRSQLSVGRADLKLGSDRQRFLKTLQTQPFWRPVLSATFSTRPLALTFARLARGQERGTPFYATIVPEDRKDGKSFTRRMRQLRLRRMRSLLLDFGRLLRGDRGGFVGIRFNPSDHGRAIGGEGLADPLPLDKRVIKIGVGEWFKDSEELKNLVRDEAEEEELRDGAQVFGLDEFGYRTDGVAWPFPSECSYKSLPSLVLGDVRETMTKRQMQERLEEYIRRNGRRAVAHSQSVRHNAVYYPPANTQEQRTSVEAEADTNAEIEAALVDLISDKPEPTQAEA